MKAEEARKLATTIKENLIKENYDKIISKIQTEVSKGCFSVQVSDSSLYGAIAEKLKSDGYTLRYYRSGINEYSCEITW